MGIFKKLFGGSSSQGTAPQDDFTTASWIASIIDGVINTQGFSELEKPNAAIVMNNDSKISMVWNLNLEIGGQIKSFVYLNELYGFKELKSSFGFDIAKDLPPKDAKEIMQMMGASLGQQAVDRLSISALHELKGKFT